MKLLLFSGEKWRFRQSGRTERRDAFRSEPMNQAGCPVHNSDLCLSGANVLRLLSKVNFGKKRQQMLEFWNPHQIRNPTHRCMGFECYRVQPLLQKQQFLHARIAASIETVEVDPRRKPITAEGGFVITRLLLFVHKLSNLLAECVVDCERSDGCI